MDFKTFISKYQDDAKRFDLQKELPLVYFILQDQIIKLQSAETESEITEIIKFSEKAIKEFKNKIITSIINESYKINYINDTPPHIQHLRVYLDYSELNKKANLELNIQPQLELNIQPQLEPKKTKCPTKTLWFFVGLKFATGELMQIYKDNNHNSTQTAIKLGNKNLRPYITESIANTNTNDKNIFSKSKKLDIIIKYCEENDIIISDEFRDNLPNQYN